MIIGLKEISMKIEKKHFVGGYTYTGQKHPTGGDVVNWFATSLEMPSKGAAKAWMNEKLRNAKKYNQRLGFSYYETISKSYEIEVDEDGKIEII